VDEIVGKAVAVDDCIACDVREKWCKVSGLNTSKANHWKTNKKVFNNYESC
jgi:hypothetical protein